MPCFKRLQLRLPLGYKEQSRSTFADGNDQKRTFKNDPARVFQKISKAGHGPLHTRIAAKNPAKDVIHINLPLKPKPKPASLVKSRCKRTKHVKMLFVPSPVKIINNATSTFARWQLYGASMFSPVAQPQQHRHAGPINPPRNFASHTLRMNLTVHAPHVRAKAIAPIPTAKNIGNH